MPGSRYDAGHTGEDPGPRFVSLESVGLPLERMRLVLNLRAIVNVLAYTMRLEPAKATGSGYPVACRDREPGCGQVVVNVYAHLEFFFRRHQISRPKCDTFDLRLS